MKTIRKKVSDGVTYSWTVGKNRDGKFRVLSVGKPSNRMPIDFAPFAVMDAALNRNTVFDTEAEVIDFIASI